MESILFKGIAYVPAINYYKGKEAKIFFREEKFLVYINNSWDEKKKAIVLKNAMNKWYTNQADESILKGIEHFSSIIGVKYNNYRIKDQKTRWGSCSQKGNINFNWRLIMAPEWVLNYVVIHELCHLKQMNHSNKFWSLVEEHCPCYKEAKLWLKENGHKLTGATYNI